MKTRIFTLAAAAVFGLQVMANELWPIVLDQTTADKVPGAIQADFRPNEIDQFLYIWDGTYSAGDPTGLNFYGNADGYLALKVGGAGWSGGGFCLTEQGTSWQDAEALRQKIVANPDNYFFHIALKSTDAASHCFYLFGTEATKFTIGQNVAYDGPIYDNFTRNGEWHDFFIPMAKYVNALSNTTVQAGCNVLVLLSEGIQGVQLNMDAAYFCDKEFMENEYLLHPGAQPVIPAENRTIVVDYLDKQGESLREDAMTFHFPSIPVIEGFEFVGWQPVEEIIGETLTLQAVYKRVAEGMPAVVSNPANPAQKLIRDGQVYILRDKKVYTLKGQQVK